MFYDKISVGKNPPFEVNVIIEISANSGFIKYEFDKELSTLVVDRIMQSSMQYPCNYGFVPHTLSGDGDPVDVLLYTNHPIVPGALISTRPIGVLVTEDENGQDEKILAVPTTKTDISLAHINDIKDMPEIILDKIRHFFTHYKDLEKGKWVKVLGWQGAENARTIITESVKRVK